MSLYSRFSREVAALDLPVVSGPLEVVSNFRLAGLPEPAQRYLRFMGVVGRPRDWSFRCGFTGRFRTSPRKPWMKCEAWQYNNRPAVARVFHIRIRFGGLLPVVGRDTYVDGRGRMLIRLLDLVTMEDGRGEEYNTGELVTYLNDAVLIAPSMLLAPEISWAAADDSSFDVSLADHGRSCHRAGQHRRKRSAAGLQHVGPVLLRSRPSQATVTRALEYTGLRMGDGGGTPASDGRPGGVAASRRAVCLRRFPRHSRIAGFQRAARCLTIRVAQTGGDATRGKTAGPSSHGDFRRELSSPGRARFRRRSHPFQACGRRRPWRPMPGWR